MTPPLLEAEGLRKVFGGVVAVRDVDLAVAEGSISAVIGPNGAGKTSLFNVVTGFESATRGQVHFDGRSITGLRPWQVSRRGMIRTFQTPVGFPALSVWENLMVGGTAEQHERLMSGLFGGWRGAERETSDRARSLLDRLGLWERRNDLLSDLPPGDVKLVDFARQLMAGPRLLLLDEPASGVDPASIDRLAGVIRGLRDDGVTVLVIDHNIGFVLGIADVIHVMALGELIASGTPEEIMRDPHVIEIYLGKSQ